MKILENYTQVKGLFLGAEGRWDGVGLWAQGGPFPPGASSGPASLSASPRDDTLVHGLSVGHVCGALWPACAGLQDPTASLLPLEALPATNMQDPERALAEQGSTVSSKASGWAPSACGGHGVTWET